MDNQHRKIKGYNELSQEQIDLMNLVKTKAAELGEVIDKVAMFLHVQSQDPERSFHGIESGAEMWLDTGELDVKTGVMKIVRSIAQPLTF